MKHLPLLLALALLPVAVRAQEPAVAPTPSVSTPADAAGAPAGKERRHGRRREAMQNLSPEEQAKLKAARSAAQEDPEVKAAEANRSSDKKGYRKALVAAMIRKDPSVGPILAKMKGEKKHEKIF